MGYRSQPCVAPIPCAFATSLGIPGVAPQRVIAFFHKLNMSNFSVFMRVPASSYLAALVRPKIISTQRVSSPLLRGGPTGAAGDRRCRASSHAAHAAQVGYQRDLRRTAAGSRQLLRKRRRIPRAALRHPATDVRRRPPGCSDTRVHPTASLTVPECSGPPVHSTVRSSSVVLLLGGGCPMPHFQPERSTTNDVVRQATISLSRIPRAGSPTRACTRQRRGPCRPRTWARTHGRTSS